MGPLALSAFTHFLLLLLLLLLLFLVVLGIEFGAY
jgi:hypothetical protein